MKLLALLSAQCCHPTLALVAFYPWVAKMLKEKNRIHLEILHAWHLSCDQDYPFLSNNRYLGVKNAFKMV